MSNAASALKASSSPEDLGRLLERWVSVAESQLCALEVLCTQLPEMNRLLESNMLDLGTSFSLLADETQKQAENVRGVVEAVKEAGVKSPALDQAVVRANVSVDKMMVGVSSAIVGMQFQDRVSQNLVIALNISKQISAYLSSAIEETCAVLPSKHLPAEVLDRAFAGTLLKCLTLGELQHQFVERLIAHHYIRDGAEIGARPPTAEELRHRDNVELF